jgi:hypothetical protein
MYDTYCKFIEEFLAKGDLSYFRSDERYTGILEHVSYKQGYDYLQCLLKNTKLTFEDVSEFCSLNDKVGGPKIFSYPRVRAAPTSLRYLYHAHLALTHFITFNKQMDFVEIGGGYGGLALAVDYLAKKYGILESVKSYTVIDLTAPIKLQQEVLKQNTLSIPVKFIDAATHGQDISTTNMFLISNYAFSYFSEPIRKKYEVSLFPKVKHGFMAWNFIKTYNFGFELRVENEVPLTGPAETNRYVYF